jgi:SPP1 gp7 family putative phage head morphogenesis protein
MPGQIKINLLLAFDKAPEDAVKYLKQLGIKITWNWQEQLKAIKEKAFTISKITNADLLQEIQNQLIEALNKGIPYTDFKKELDDILKNRGYLKKEDGSQWRLDTIYRTNLQGAYMAGRYAQQQEVSDEFPYWEYVAILDNRTTNSCRSLNGTILPANDPFWKTNYPPRHFNCRARVISHNEITLKQYNKSVSDPAKFKNIKPAPGFEYAPGEWKPDLSKYTPKLKNALMRLFL